MTIIVIKLSIKQDFKFDMTNPNTLESVVYNLLDALDKLFA